MNYGIKLYPAKENALALLAMATPESFARSRQKILLSLVGLEKPPRDAIRDTLANLGQNLEIDPETIKALTKAVISGEMTPYEVIGAIKDDASSPARKPGKRRWSAKSMTRTWTALSMATALLDQTDKPVLPESYELEKELEKQAIAPKTRELTKSCTGQKPANGRYYVSRPHLANSTKTNPNWAEILGNLTADAAGAALELLKSDSKNIRKKEAARNLLWPEPGPALTENRRLNEFLHSLPPFPNGRTTIVACTLASSKNPPTSVATPTLGEPTNKQKSKFEKLEKLLEAVLNPKPPKTTAPTPFYPSGPPTPKISPSGETAAKLSGLARVFDGLRFLHPDQQKQLEEKLFAAVRSLPEDAGAGFGLLWTLATGKIHKDLLRDTATIPDLTPELNEKRFLALAQLEPNSPSLLHHLEEGVRRDAVLAAAELGSAIVRAHAEKSLAPLEETPAPEKPGWLLRNKLDPQGATKIVACTALEGKTLDAKTTFGKQKNSIVHIAAWWRSAPVLEEAIRAAEAAKIEPLAPNARGTTPAFFCTNWDKAALMVDYPVDTENPNQSHKTVATTSPALMGTLRVKLKRAKAVEKMRGGDAPAI